MFDGLSDFEKVGEFHRKMRLDYVRLESLCVEPDGFAHVTRLSEPNGAGPRQLSREAIDFRHKFMQEELDEFLEAVDAGDEAKALDALVDLSYVVLGTAHLMGFPWPEAFAAVHEANMQKERATGAGDPRSTRGHALDVVKPKNWKAPDIAGLLRKFGWGS